MARRASNEGFTLLELVLYVALMGVMLLALSVFSSALLRARVKAQAVAEVDQQGVAVMQVITQALRNADSVSAPAAGASAPSMTLAMPSPDNDPTVFDADGGAVRVSEGGGAAVALTNGRVTVSGLSFENLSRAGTPGTVRVQFTITHLNPSSLAEYDVTRTFVSTGTLRFP